MIKSQTGIGAKAGGSGMAGMPGAPRSPLQRTASLDNLKVFLTVLVVLHHAGQPYGPTGGSWPLSHASKAALLGPFFHVNASFFMGLFFLLSAYVLPATVDRKGAAVFLRERLRRFGIPILGFGLGFMPLARHFVEGKPWAECFHPFVWAHLWFLGHLLVYALAYAIYRRLTVQRAAGAATGPAGPPRPDASRPFPANVLLLAYVVGLAAVSTLLRTGYPIDRWVTLGVPAEVAHLPQYASLFLFGLVAARHQWLQRIPPATGRAWLALGLAMLVFRFTYTLAHLHFLSGEALWLDAIWNLWEACICVGFCVGLPYAFGRHLAGSPRWARFASRHAFAVYVLHLPVLVLIQMALERSSAGPLTLTLASAMATVLLCYCAAAGTAALVAALRRAAPQAPWRSRESTGACARSVSP